MSNQYEIRKNTLMIGTHKPMSDNSSNVVPKHIGHDNIGIFAVRHVHGTRHHLNYLQVRTEHLDSRIEQIDLEMFLLLPRHLRKHQLVNQFEVGILHYVYYPTQMELNSAFL